MIGVLRELKSCARVHSLTTTAERSSINSPPIIVIQATRGLAPLQLRALWEYRDLFYFLVWRDVKVRHKQTALGVA